MQLPLPQAFVGTAATWNQWSSQVVLGQDGGRAGLWETAPWCKLGAREADEYTAPEQTPPEHRPFLTPQGGPGPCSSPCIPEGGGQLPGASPVPTGSSRAKRS